MKNKKIILSAGLILNLTGSMFGTVPRAEHLAKDCLSIYLFSDIHDLNDKNQKIVEDQTKQILEAAQTLKPLFIIEDSSESYEPEFTELFKNKTNLKKEFSSKYNIKYFGLPGLAALAQKNNINTINVDTHSLGISYILHELKQGNHQLIPFTINQYNAMLNRWKMTVQGMKGNLVQQYKKSKEKFFSLDPLHKVATDEPLQDYLKKYNENNFKHATEAHCVTFLEAKVLNAIDQHKTNQPIFVYMGGFHIDSIRNVLLKNGFNTISDNGIPANEADAKHKRGEEVPQADLSKVFKPSFKVKMKLFWLKHKNKIYAFTLAAAGLTYYYRNTIKNLMSTYLPHSLLRYLPQWTQKSKR